MPHDRDGFLVKPGDIVTVAFKVESVTQTDEFCNVSLVSIEGMPPNGQKTTLGAINTRQTVKVG